MPDLSRDLTRMIRAARDEKWGDNRIMLAASAFMTRRETEDDAPAAEPAQTGEDTMPPVIWRICVDSMVSLDEGRQADLLATVREAVRDWQQQEDQAYDWDVDLEVHGYFARVVQRQR